MATTTKTGTKSAATKASTTDKASDVKSTSSVNLKSTAKPQNKTGKMEDSEFHQFFIDELKDIYWAEKHLAKALPKMKKAATSSELAAAFDKHTAETESHIETLDQIFALMDEKAVAKKCDAMAGLLEEANGIIEETDKGTMIRDAGLILAAQKVEHYEIATYGTLKVFAENMGHTEVANLLGQTLENEKATDVSLTEIAESFVNEEAASE
ncbi:ferritin-like domain-containing protein [Pedobacter sp. UBA5917]|jgi:ferritin-like metal-binding protein YciE|uniref:YciE/YciF ferroxidase family protein n=1 Tax=Pedobacter sp. UBA5917 TaxID=1947061 RepID=UPI0025D44FDF|nr:ferritin-like domain-containing protein [Pedobacter sp. UBA5917]